MKIYLRILAVFYFIGFILHFLDVLDLRLHVSTMSISWRIWIILLLCGDFVAAIGLWQQKKWGIQIFVTIALAQLVAYSGLIDSPTNQIFLICFHLITLVLYFFIKNLVNS